MDGGSRIHYGKLVERGTILAKEKIQAIQDRLAKLETFGIAYLTPFASNAGRQKEGHTVLREPLPEVKTRPDYLNTENRRNQG